MVLYEFVRKQIRSREKRNQIQCLEQNNKLVVTSSSTDVGKFDNTEDKTKRNICEEDMIKLRQELIGEVAQIIGSTERMFSLQLQNITRKLDDIINKMTSIDDTCRHSIGASRYTTKDNAKNNKN